MQIYACGDFYQAAAEPLCELRSAVGAAIGEPVRRIGRFIQLALIGAGRCARGQLPADTGVYLCSGRGDLETTIEVMVGLFRGGQAPKPLSFVNTVSNAACFYVARALQLQGRSNFVCNRYFAFESVLQLALLDAESGGINSALIGSIDVACLPLAQHRQRLDLPVGATVGEGSHWIWIGPADAARPRLGDILAAQHFTDQASLLDWIARQKFSSADCLISAGQFLTQDVFAQIQKHSGLHRTFDYREGRAYYDSQSGAAISEFLKAAPDTSELLHVNANPCGEFSVLRMRR